MTENDLNGFRALLEQVRAELIAGLESGAEEAAPVSPDSSIGRLTRQDAMQAQQMALALRRRNQGRLQQVEAALRRVENGTYGICARCEEEISRARLTVRPETPLCVECALGTGVRNP
jgi:DnaK suppressor protein